MSGETTTRNPGVHPPRERNAWLDVARGYGMFLVFYGHLVERFANLSLASAFVQFKFIYAFHMPIFFVFAGLVARSEPGFFETLKRGMLTRILPAVFFNILLVPLWLPPSPLANTVHGQHIGSNLLLLFAGKPIYNFLTWFLFCLFVVELLHAALRRYVQRDGWIFATVLFFLLVGQELTRNLGSAVRWTGVPANFWMIHEALVALAFHQFGYWLRRVGLLGWRPARGWLVAICVACWLGVGLTFDLNQGPFRSNSHVVLMALSSHGHRFWFPLTALLGTGGIMTLAMLSPRFAPMRWVGERSLLFLGLNGVFFALNAFVARRLLPYMPDAGLLQIVALAGLTAGCLAMSAPIATMLLRGLPQIFGRPYEVGPILPALARRAERLPGSSAPD